MRERFIALPSGALILFRFESKERIGLVVDSS
jgi:hypothetical protein